MIARSRADGTLRRILQYVEYSRPGTQFNRFMYTGTPFVLGGTCLLRNRFYDSDDSRFWQTDPIGSAVVLVSDSRESWRNPEVYNQASR